MAALATFFPCWLFTVVPAPHYERFAKNARLKAFVQGVTAAATGAIGGATFVLGRRAIVDLPTLVIALATLAVIVRFKKVNEPMVIVATGAIGIGLRALLPM